MIPLSDTEELILDSALALFLRYGLAKTSMSDIAKQASLSRTALYNHFATKESIFKSISQRINQNVRAGVLTAVDTEGDWQGRLKNVMEARLVWVFELLSSPPHGRELIDEKNRLCGGEVLATNDAFFGYVQKLCRERAVSDTDAERMARILIRSVNGIMDAAVTEAEARIEIRQLIDYMDLATRSAS